MWGGLAWHKNIVHMIYEKLLKSNRHLAYIVSVRGLFVKLSEFILCVEKRKLTLDFCLDLVGRCAAWKSFSTIVCAFVDNNKQKQYSTLGSVGIFQNPYSHYSRAKDSECSDWPWQQVRIQVKKYQFMTDISFSSSNIQFSESRISISPT